MEIKQKKWVNWVEIIFLAFMALTAFRIHQTRKIEAEYEKQLETERRDEAIEIEKSNAMAQKEAKKAALKYKLAELEKLKRLQAEKELKQEVVEQEEKKESKTMVSDSLPEAVQK